MAIGRLNTNETHQHPAKVVETYLVVQWLSWKARALKSNEFYYRFVHMNKIKTTLVQIKKKKYCPFQMKLDTA